jgi:two-component sensor histidine kinase
MNFIATPAVSELLARERDILTRIAAGGPLAEVLRDLMLLVELPSNGEMLASVLFLSPDGKYLLEGAAPSLPKEYNAAIHGAAIGAGVGSCGTAAFTGQPVIVSDIDTDPLWKDYKHIALKHGLRACWSIPIKAADGSVLGTFANYYREPKQPTARDIEVNSMIARTTGIAIERHRNELMRQRAEEQRILLLRELNHRVKNVFALASGLVALSARHTGDSKELAASMQKRLNALGRAHDLVRPDLSSDFGGVLAATFRKVVDDILEPYATDETNGRIALEGPDFPLDAAAVTNVALILHELATNAIKYGCLRENGGTLSVVWTVEEGMLRIVWTESGFACAGAPTHTGFGSTLTKTTVEYQLHGQISREWRSDGMTVTMALPITEIAGSYE